MDVKTNNYWLMHGDCLERLNEVEAGSIDAIICDLPYGQTACSWDTVIPFEPLWAHFKRVLKDRGAAVLFGSEPFSSLLRVSNLDWYKYDWVWEKVAAANFVNVKYTPLKIHELISVFSRGTLIYNPQMRQGKTNHKAGKNPIMARYVTGGMVKRHTTNFDGFKHPESILRFPKYSQDCNLHPTQKPLPLLEYLVKTYTNPGDTVLDCVMGSGTTGAACGRLNRRFIGIEKDAGYFAIAENRIKNAYGDFVRTPEEVKKGQLALFEVNQ